MKRLRNLFVVLALGLSHAMCAVVAWIYRDIVCGMEHMGFSAPPDIAFLYAIPFAVAILLCLVLAYDFHRKMPSPRGEGGRP